MMWALFALLLLAPGLAEAATYYVSPTGTNAACGSITGYANGKTTIAAGLACLAAGDTLNIGDGTYAESIAVGAIPSGVSDANRTIIQAQTNRAAILRPTSGTIRLQLRNQSNITITGLYLDGNSTEAAGGTYSATVGLHITSTTGSASNITFQDGQIEDTLGTSSGAGMLHIHFASPQSGTRPTNIRILRNIIQRHNWTGTGTQYSINHCIYTSATSSIFEGNTITDCYGSGFTMHASSGSTGTGNIVRSNWIENCSQGAGIRLAGDSNFAYNNVVKNCGGVAESHSAISIHLNDADLNEADHNTIIDAKYGCMMIRPSSGQTSTGNKMRNNLCSGGTTTFRDEGVTSTITNNRCDSGCATSASPGFVDSGAENYHLAAGSAMINAGIFLASVTTDYDGVSRSAGGSPADIGAFEYQATPPDTTPPTTPANCTATSDSQTQITLLCDASTDDLGAITYSDEQCDGAACVDFAEIRSTAALSFASTGLTANTLYRHRRRAHDGTQFGSYSSIFEATTQSGADVTAPTAPADLTVTILSIEAVQLLWTASTDAVGVTTYKVERGVQSDCSDCAEILTPTDVTVLDETAAVSTTYYYRVRAADLAGNNSNYSGIVSGKTPDSIGFTGSSGRSR